jgi:hypothetical protein
VAVDQGYAQPPPADLAKREIPLVKLSALPEKAWCRIGKTKHPPLYYSTDAGWRFSRPDMPGTLYLGCKVETCFWEVFWDDLATRPSNERRLDYGKVAERSAWTAVMPADLVLVDTYDSKGRIEMGAHGGTFNGPYSICQQWAKALREHPLKPHGILYGSARDLGSRCLALFAEYQGTHAPTFKDGTPLVDHIGLVSILSAYGIPPVIRNGP